MYSREWEIDCEMRDLIGKLVRGTITQGERETLYELQRERVERMTPKRLSDPGQQTR